MSQKEDRMELPSGMFDLHWRELSPGPRALALHEQRRFQKLRGTERLCCSGKGVSPVRIGHPPWPRSGLGPPVAAAGCRMRSRRWESRCCSASAIFNQVRSPLTQRHAGTVVTSLLGHCLAVVVRTEALGALAIVHIQGRHSGGTVDKHCCSGGTGKVINAMKARR